MIFILACIRMPAWRPQATRLVTRTKESDAHASDGGTTPGAKWKQGAFYLRVLRTRQEEFL